MSLDIRELRDDERAALDAGLALAQELIGGTDTYSWSAAQEPYDLVLRDRADPMGEAVIAIALYFGELVRINSGFEWVRVSDEYGEETCLSPPGKSIVCAPISMIQKRLEKPEALNVQEMGEGAIELVLRRVEEGQVGSRGT